MGAVLFYFGLLLCRLLFDGLLFPFRLLLYTLRPYYGRIKWKAKNFFWGFSRWIKGVDDPRKAARLLVIASIVIALVGFVWLYILNQRSYFVSDFYANVATELLSIAITVLIIDRLYAIRSENQEKQRIIRQLGSRSNEFALEAVRLCNEDGRKWLTDGSLKNADLNHANLEGARLEGAYLYHVNLKGANLNGINLKSASLAYADLEGANLRGANLEDADLWQANLSGANLMGANLKDAYLEDASLDGVDLSDANLKGANLCIARLKGANLRGANLEGTNISIADGLRNAVYDKFTVWPEMFGTLHAQLRHALNWDKMSDEERVQWYARLKK